MFICPILISFRFQTNFCSSIRLSQLTYKVLLYDKLKAIPNPFVDKTYLHFTLPYSSEVNIQVFDMLGTHINTMEFDLNAGSQKIEISAQTAHGERLLPGCYLVKFEADGIEITEKLLLMK